MIRNYLFHNIPIRVESNDEEIFFLFEGIFGLKLTVPLRNKMGLFFRFQVGKNPYPLNSKTKPLQRLSLLRKRKIFGQFDGKSLYLTDKKSFIKVDYGKNRAMFHLHPITVATPKLMSHTLIPLALIELLKNRGFYYIHASCADINGKGVLFAGGPTSGKSSACYSLVREGAKWVSDDAVLIKRTGSKIVAYSFMKEFSLLGGTGALFSELSRNTPGAKADHLKSHKIKSRFLHRTVPRLCFLTGQGKPFKRIKPSDFIGSIIRENEFLFLQKKYATMVLSDLKMLHEQGGALSISKIPLILRSRAFYRRIAEFLD